MKLRNFISYGAAVGMAFAPIAASQAQTVAASSNYLVVRDGKVVTGASLKAGDRVVTRGNAGAKIALNDCTIDVPAASTVTITENSCSSSVAALSLARADYGMTDGSAMKGAGWLVATLALAAAITGAAIAAGGTKHPTSP